MSGYRILCSFAALTSCFFGVAQDLSDTSAVFQIDSMAIVTAVRNTSGIRGDLAKGLDIDVQSIQTFPKILGTSDPIKFAQALPGVTKNSDWESGLKILGCDASQSVTKLCGVPVFGQGRFLGLFSVYNPGHFKNMRFATGTDARRIGGELCMDTSDTLFTALHGEGNLGPISTHATFSFPLGKKSSLTVSGRRSFIDIFYKDLFKFEGSSLNYYFYDINASYLWTPDSYNTLDVNLYYGYDYGWAKENGANYYIGAGWGNCVGNVRWRFNKAGWKINTQLYASSYFMEGCLGITQNAGTAKDDIIDIGLESKASWNDWGFALEADYYNIQPQNIFDESSTSPKTDLIPRQHSLLTTFRAARTFRPGDWTIKPSLSASLYSDFTSRNFYPGLDPEVFSQIDFYQGGRLSLDAGYKHQYIFMTGLTNSGFPVEFWLGAGTFAKPQSSLYATLSYSVNFLQEAYTLNLQGYGKRLWDLVEYSGYASEIIGGNYDLKSMLLPGNGWNYGATVQLQKNGGKFTGWISYSWGRSLRKFDNPAFPGVYPSNFERIHEFNAVASYKTGHWEFGGNFIFASGAPYTPLTAVYYMNETLMVKYGERNSRNLSPYIRLDLSVSYNIRMKGRFRDGVNVSVQNTTARNNQLMALLKVTDREYSYSPLTLSVPVIPSINYYCTF